jgi:hypothetical protein
VATERLKIMSGSDSHVAAVQILAHEILYELGLPVSVDVVSKVSRRIDEAVSQLVGGERERCVQLCRQRAVLWSNTAMASMPMGREESCARANEANYLADSINIE